MGRTMCRSLRDSKLWILVAVVLVLLSGILLACWTMRKTDDEMREDLLRDARVLAQTVNIGRLKLLSGTEADLLLPEYLRLKDQFIAARHAFPRSRFLYLLGRRPDGTVFFYVDSEPAGFPDESPSGRIYEEVTPEELFVFEYKESTITGPADDRRGSRVSALVPVIDPKTGDLVAVLGMDAEAAAWEREVKKSALVPLWSFFLLAFLFFTVCMIIEKYAKGAGRTRWRNKAVAVVLVAAAGLTITLAAVWIVHRNESRSIYEKFSLLAEIESEHVAHAMKDLRDLNLEGLGLFFESSDFIDRMEFSNYVAHLLALAEIDAWGWVPCVPAEEKDLFEKAARREGLVDFTIWERDTAGNPIPAGGRNFYYPVFYREPVAGSQRILGYDIGSEPVRRAAMETAMNTGLPTATDLITLTTGTDSRQGMLLLRAVFAGREQQELMGFVQAVLRLETLLQVTTRQGWSRDNPAMIIDLWKLPLDSAPYLVATTGEPDERDTYSGSEHVCGKCISFVRPLFAFGKTFAIKVCPGIRFNHLHMPKSGWAAALAGLLMTVTASLVTNYFIDRREKLEHLVNERTRELEAKGNELEQLYLQLDEELSKARQIHGRTLPRTLPAVEGISLASYYRPAQKLGGDFYDVLRHGDKLIIYLSDVTGHGLDGAMLSFFIKHTIEGGLAFSPAGTITPGKIVRYLAGQFSRENLPDEYFICIFLAVLDLQTMELTYTAAGFQDAPLVRLGDGEQLALISQELFINLVLPVEELNFREGRLTLTPGTTIFFNTDGLSEQGSRGSYYGDRLKDVFYQNSHLPPEAIVHAVNEDFCIFNNGSLQGDDDITFLVLQVDPPGRKTYRLELAGDFGELKRLRKEVVKIAGGFAEVDMLEVCLHELVSNAIEHGSGLDGSKTVSVELTITGAYIQAVVEDQGEGFDWREQMNRPLELEGNDERGRGIAMVRMCCDRLFYNEKGNRATIICNISRWL